MSAPKDPDNRAHALMDALADHVAGLSDEEILADSASEGADLKKEAAGVRSVLLAGLQRAKRERLDQARIEREKAIAALELAKASLPRDAATRRSLLTRAVTRKPQMREAVVTLQHRNFESLSDDDVESALKQLQHLGLLEDDDDDTQ